MKSMFLGLLLSISFSTLANDKLNSTFATSEKSFSGCILALTASASRGDSFKRLVIMNPWTGLTIESGKGQAVFQYKGKEWNISAEYIYTEDKVNSKVFPWYKGELKLVVNGIAGKTSLRTHHGDRDYVETYFFPINDSLEVENVNPTMKERNVPFNIFSICTPRFEEQDRSDTIYLK